MKKPKRIIAFIVLIIGAIVLTIFGIKFFLNENRLTIEEKKWIDGAISSNQLLNINIINDANIFGNNGEGVYYTFLNDFLNSYNLNVNKATFNYGESQSGITLGLSNKIDENDSVIYTDHYVLINKNMEIINSTDELEGKTIYTLSADLEYISKYVNNLNLGSISTSAELFALVDSGNYAIVPLHYYLNEILNKKYSVVYHFSDVNIYYTLRVNDDIFSSILKKYYNTWVNNFSEAYNANLLELMVNSLGVSQTDLTTMQDNTYNYGFVNNSPYEVISGGKYGGIVAMYLRNFSKLTGIDIKFSRYRNYTKFTNAINSGKVDFYFNSYNFDNSYVDTVNGISASYVIVANNKNDLVINSFASLENFEVYVDRNSIIYDLVKSNGNIKIIEYDTIKDILKLNNDDAIIILDKNTFDYYKIDNLSNYTVRYESSINDNYHFSVDENNILYVLLNAYVNIVDNNKVVNDGIYDHANVVKTGKIINNIAKYFIICLCLTVLIFILYVKKNRRIKISKKIKKDDTIRFIDQLTLLKNRNYLSENIKEWSKNTIYPQIIIVVDLNHIQQINDTKGYEEGDKQIKAAANALIKTQLDNSDIIRTDGNEFVIYMVGYTQKQVTNYIHKLNKEFKKLPYEYGAEYGYSIIIDDIKTIEDALNEATKALKKQKGIINEKEN